LAFDITNACAGMFTGIHLADTLLKTGAIRRALVVSGEYITHLTETAQREIESFMDARLACLTLGDAGAAIILEQTAQTGTGFRDLHLRTFGRYSSYCIAKAADTGGMIMYTDSIGLTDVAVRSGAQHAIDLLQRNGWPPESFHHLIMHQTSGMTMNSARKEINRVFNRTICHDGNTVNNLEQRGNTASTSHFVALADQIQNNRIHSGDRVVFSITASGLTIGTALYVLDDLPDRLRQKERPETSQQKRSLEQRRLDTTGTSPGIRIESVGTLPKVAIGKPDSMDLLHQAAIHCFGNSSYQCNDIGLLIYSGVYRSGYLLEPAYASLLAGKLDMNATALNADQKQTLAFDIFNGTLGFLNACYVAQQMIAAGHCEAAMIVASESENNAGQPADERLGICETASAIILDLHPLETKGFNRFVFRYFPDAIDAYTTYCDTRKQEPFLQIGKDPALEALYIDCIVPVVQEILAIEKRDRSQVTMVFPPQISSGFIARLSEALHLSKEKFIDAVQDGPDLFSSSLPYAFAYAQENGLVKPGDVGLVIAVGSGIQVGCAIYHF
jgi:3-oxoacyl-[acyl-carrier-protein] synthase III